ncbi:MAG: hypothetical protein K6G88_12030 [Lachnospiraceae bacterium]|nr:hypothetical protein [Lachnospiraceae bacterium]
MVSIAYYDEDIAYAESFCDFVSRDQKLPFKIKLFTNNKVLKKHFEKGGSDVLLVASDSYSEEIEKYGASEIIIFNGNKKVICDLPYRRVHKYQSVYSIIDILLNYIADMGLVTVGDSVFSGKKAEIIGIYSPVSRSGKTSFALTMGQLLSNEKEVLYINFEEFSGLSSLMNGDYKSDLADLFYHFKQSREMLPVKLHAVVRKNHGMDYIPPMRYSEDLRNIKSDDWVGLINEIAGMEYDYIILDLSNMVRDIFTVLEQCDYIYMPICSDRISMLKLNEYEEFLFLTGRESILEKTNKIKIPKQDISNWQENFMEELTWGCMGDFVKKLLLEKEAG